MRRETTREDFNRVYEIYMDETVNPYVNFEIMSKEEFLPIFDEMIESGGLQVYELDGKVIAALVVRRFQYRLKHLAYIGALGIKQQYQGRGFGIKIMQELIKDLRMDGVKRIELRVEADNKRAINFYKKLGFEAEGTHRKYMKRERDADFVDTHLMGLLLEKG
jgi:RimJ/RimL family protein N-acetyltransferase